MSRHPVSPKRVLLIVLLDLFKVRKMTNFNYDFFKVSKMYFFKMGSFFGVNAYVYSYGAFFMVKNCSVMPRKLYKRCSPENIHIDMAANI